MALSFHVSRPDSDSPREINIDAPKISPSGSKEGTDRPKKEKRGHKSWLLGIASRPLVVLSFLSCLSFCCLWTSGAQK